MWLSELNDIFVGSDDTVAATLMYDTTNNIIALHQGRAPVQPSIHGLLPVEQMHLRPLDLIVG